MAFFCNKQFWMATNIVALVMFSSLSARATGLALSGMEAGSEGGDCGEISTEGGSKCDAGCICKALTTGFANPQGSPVFQSNMQLFARQSQFAGLGPSLGPSHNLIDSVCLGLDNPGAAKAAFSAAMGDGARRFRFAEDRTAQILSASEAGSESGGLLGDDHECLDLCFRLSTYMQEHVDGLHCTLFKSLAATKPTDPYGIPGLDFEAAAGGEGSEAAKKFRFQSSHAKSSAVSLPPLWQQMGIKIEDMPDLLKTSKYYSRSRLARGTPRGGDIVEDALTPALV